MKKSIIVRRVALYSADKSTRIYLWEDQFGKVLVITKINGAVSDIAGTDLRMSQAIKSYQAKGFTAALPPRELQELLVA